MIKATSHLNDTVQVWELNRPDRLNALDWDMADALDAVINGLPECARAVIITGAGRAFSAGGDFAFLEARPQKPPAENKETMIRFYEAFLKIRDMDVPVIAAVNGPAVGAGFCFALACDIRIASQSACFAANFVRVGIHPGMAATGLLKAAVGDARAAELMYTGRMVEAEEAFRIGIVSNIVQDGSVIDAAMAIADDIQRGSPLAVAELKKTLTAGTQALASVCQREAEAQAICYADPSYVEGLTAIKEKRLPRWMTEGT